MKRDLNCTRCSLHESAEYVCLLGANPRRCRVMIVGEAPGHREDASGTPFVGPSGQLLRGMLEAHGLKDVFITNAVCCRPPDNRTPSKREIKACGYWLQKQVEYVQPLYVLLLGNVPLQACLGVTGIKSLRGRPVERDGIIYLPTFHPAYILRDPTQRPTLDADIRLFAGIVKSEGIPQEEGVNLRIVNTPRLFEEMIDDLNGCVSFDIETTGLYPWAQDARINSLGFGTRTTQWVIPWEHEENPWVEKGARRGKLRVSERDYMIECLNDEIPNCYIVAQNGKFDMLWMRVKHGVTWPVDFDTMLAHYMLDENSRHGLKELSQVFCNATNYDVDKNTKLGRGSFADLARYQAHDLYYTRRLRYIFGRMLYKEGDVKRVFDRLMMPAAEMFTRAEFHGVYINSAQFSEAESYLKGELKTSLRELEKYGDINWRSPKQLGALLFDQLKIDVVERTGTGAPSTSESVLKRIDHPVAAALMKHRAAAQQMSFFIEGWRPFLVNNRLHPSFKLHGAVTGRLSCEHPNLQQVPRDPRIRSLITAPKGWTFVEADLSQIELRIAAELSNERTMLEAFEKGIDIHWLTATREITRAGGMIDLITKTTGTKDYSEAARLLLEMGHRAAIERDKRWKELRKKAKAINFGFLYGMGWRKFKMYARDNYGVDVTDQQAQESRRLFFELYPGLIGWHKRQRDYAARNGYVLSLSGRKRRLPDAQSSYDTEERAAAQRQAINSPVQCFASELNMMAALQIDRELLPRVHVLATVHDATLMEVRNDVLDKAVKRIHRIMCHPSMLDELDIRIRVPIEAEVTIGPWGKGQTWNPSK